MNVEQYRVEWCKSQNDMELGPGQGDCETDWGACCEAQAREKTKFGDKGNKQ